MGCWYRLIVLVALLAMSEAHWKMLKNADIRRVLVSNSFNDEGCVMPEARSFVEYELGSYASRFWGTAFTSGTFSGETNSVEISCASEHKGLCPNEHASVSLPWPLGRCHLIYEREGTQSRSCYREVLCALPTESEKTPQNHQLMALQILNSQRGRVIE